MEDQEIRLDFSESPSRIGQPASDTVDILQVQLERAGHDNRTLAAEHKRVASAKMELELKLAELTKARDADRLRIHVLEANLMKAQSQSSISEIRVKSLEESISGVKGENEWWRGELNRYVTEMRTRLHELTTQNANLETSLAQAQSERGALERRVASLQTAYTTSQEKLESVQAKSRTLQKDLEASEANMVYGGGSIMLERTIQALQSKIQVSNIHEKEQKDRLTKMGRAYYEACDRIDEQTRQLQEVQNSNADFAKQVVALKEEITANKNAQKLLGLQINHLLINAQLAADSEPLLSAEEKIELSKALSIQPSYSNGMEIVFDRLAYFKDISELVHQVGEQLRVIDFLSAKCEKNEERESVENAAVTEAKDTITELNTRINELQTERDLMRSMESATKETPIAADPSGIQDRAFVLQTDLDIAKREVSSLQTQLADANKSTGKANKVAATLTEELATSKGLVDQLRAEKLQAESRSRMEESQSQFLQQQLTGVHDQKNKLDEDYRLLREQMNEKDRANIATQNALLEQVNSLRAEVTSLRHQLTESRSQLELKTSQRELAVKNTENLKNELLQSKLIYESLEQKYAILRKELEDSEERLKLRTISFTTADSDAANQLEDKLKLAEAQIQDLRMLATDTQKELDSNKKTFESQRADLDSQLSAAKASLQSVTNELNVLKNTPADTTALDAARKELAEVQQTLEKVRQESIAALAAVESKSSSDTEALQASLTESRANVESLTSRVAVLVAQNEELERNIAAIKLKSEQDIDKLSKQCETLDTTVNALRNENADLVSNKELLLEQLQAAMRPEGDDSEANMVDMSSNEDQSALINMLKRDKQTATVLFENANSKVRELEVQVSVLRDSLSRSENELASLTQSASTNTAAPDVTAMLEQSNEQLLGQIKEVTEERDRLKGQVQEIQNSIEEYQTKARKAESAAITAQEEVELVKSDRDLWKSRIGSTDDEKAAAIQAQLEEKEATLVKMKQDYDAKLEQESLRLKSATSQLKQLNSRVSELSNPSEKDTAELAKKNERISYLENEINRISDELTEEEQKKKELSAEVTNLTTKLGQVESSLNSAEKRAAEAQAAQEAAAANSEAAERVKKLEEELAAANAKIEANEQAKIDLNLEDSSVPTSDDIQKLKQALAAKSSEEEIGQLSQLIEQSTKDRLKAKFTEHLQKQSSNLDVIKGAKETLEKEREGLVQERDSLASQLEEAKEVVATIEQREAERYALKAKLVQMKMSSLEAKNLELKMAFRQIKGGSDNNGEIKTLPDGTTKIVPAASQQSVSQPAKAAASAAGPQRPQQKRPQVQRHGTKQNKRTSANSDVNDINKRLRES